MRLRVYAAERLEDELNGFVTYDRKTVKLPKSLVREISLQLRK